MVKNGEFETSPPGFKSQMHKKSGKKEFKKPPEKGTGYIIRI
jgi:hypothetical protein